jgi:hypothetical protein
MSVTYQNDLNIAVKRVELDPKTGMWVENKQSAFFIKGPIPLPWLSIAAGLPGKAINVALAICWLAGMASSNSVKVSAKALAYFCISQDAYRDGLARLEAAGLVEVDRRAGQRAIISIRSLSGNPK